MTREQGLDGEAQVLIVGAGPVGMFLALRLLARGVAVEVIDEAWNRTARSYALALHPATLALLDREGLATELVDTGHRLDRVAFYEGRERRAEVEFSGLPGAFPFALVLPQSGLERVLERRLAALGGRVRWNHRLAHFDEERGGITARVERLQREPSGYGVSLDRVVDQDATFRAEFVVGADGHRSAVRRCLELPFTPVGEPQTFAVFEFEASAPNWPEVRVVLAEESDNVFWPLGGGRFRGGFELVDSADFASDRQKDRMALHLGGNAYPLLGEHELAGLLGARAPWFDAEPISVGWSVAVRFDRRLAEPGGHGRAWLAGDAAHLAPPIGVHSMNVGLADAETLAARLAAILAGGEPLVSLAADDEVRRHDWRLLAGIAGKASARPATDPWIAERAGRLPAVVPASGEDLWRLLDGLGVEPPPNR